MSNLVTNTKAIDETLNFDGLDVAEKLLGTSYKADPETLALGMALMMQNNRERAALLDLMGDTNYNSTLNQYLEVIQGLGFRQVLCDEFEGRSYGDEPPCTDHYHCWWRDDGLLLCFDTFSGFGGSNPKVNGGNLYFNWQPNPGEDRMGGCRVSGGYRYLTKTLHAQIAPTEPRWNWEKSRESPEYLHWEIDHRQWVNQQWRPNSCLVGNLDCREAIKHNIQKLEKSGKFLHKWAARSFLWLVSYGETHREEEKIKAAEAEHNRKRSEGLDSHFSRLDKCWSYHDRYNLERISRMPQEVQDAITPLDPDR